MIVSQTLAELGLTVDKVTIVGVYYDECTLTTQSYGQTVFEHVNALKERSARKMIINAKFEVRPNHSAHPSYNQITVSITGDEILPPAEMRFKT